MSAANFKQLGDKLILLDKRLTEIENKILSLGEKTTATELTMNDQIQEIDKYKTRIEESFQSGIEDLHTSIRSELISCIQCAKAEINNNNNN